jgi:hypothetical protein
MIRFGKIGSMMAILLNRDKFFAELTETETVDRSPSPLVGGGFRVRGKILAVTVVGNYA